MSSDRVAIRVSDLSKCYQIYDTPKDRLKQFVIPRLQRIVSHTQRRYFREFWALRDVSFEVKMGETVGIIGRNGSGKSTLLQMVCGILSPTNGVVETHGRIAALLELGSGFNPEFTGRENVYMNANVLGLSKEEVDERFDDIAAFADIGEFIEQPVKTYSSGMFVRLAFAVIAHVNADILVIDEALAVGDAFFTQKCMRFLREFRERGTILFVSHDTASIVNFCQAAIWLEGGVVKKIGGAKEVTESYLEGLTEESYGGKEDPKKDTTQEAIQKLPKRKIKYWDQRQSLVNNSPFRNDLEIFKFDENARFYGKGGAKIIDVKLLDSEGRVLNWMVGGEAVLLKIECESISHMDRPIVGFVVKDKLGQTLFGENTFLTYQSKSIEIRKSQKFHAEFSFRMPLLAAGDYSICTAVANGSQDNHLMHQWINEAVIFKSHSSSVVAGLVGIIMDDVSLSIESVRHEKQV
jgi:lipopolysaccharide transport system ATP-binding protein